MRLLDAGNIPGSGSTLMHFRSARDPSDRGIDKALSPTHMAVKREDGHAV